MTDAQQKKKSKEVESMLKATFGTQIGQRCLEHLEEVFVNRAIYTPGQTFEHTTFKEGEASVIKKIIKEVRNGTTR